MNWYRKIYSKIGIDASKWNWLQLMFGQRYFSLIFIIGFLIGYAYMGIIHIRSTEQLRKLLMEKVELLNECRGK